MKAKSIEEKLNDFKYKPPSEIKFGMKEFDQDKKQTFWYLLKSPFINMGRVSSEELKMQNHNPAEENLVVNSPQLQD